MNSPDLFRSVYAPSEWCNMRSHTLQVRHHLEAPSDSNASIRPGAELRDPYLYRHDRHGLPVAAMLLREPAVARLQDAEVYSSHAWRQCRRHWSQPEQIGLNNFPKQPTRGLLPCPFLR